MSSRRPVGRLGTGSTPPGLEDVSQPEDHVVEGGGAVEDRLIARHLVGSALHLLWGERPAEVAFAGLAPGLVGFYQVVVRIPDDAQGESFGLRCDSYGGFGRIPVRP